MNDDSIVRFSVPQPKAAGQLPAASPGPGQPLQGPG